MVVCVSLFSVYYGSLCIMVVCVSWLGSLAACSWYWYLYIDRRYSILLKKRRELINKLFMTNWHFQYKINTSQLVHGKIKTGPIRSINNLLGRFHCNASFCNYLYTFNMSYGSVTFYFIMEHFSLNKHHTNHSLAWQKCSTLILVLASSYSLYCPYGTMKRYQICHR